MGSHAALRVTTYSDYQQHGSSVEVKRWASHVEQHAHRPRVPDELKAGAVPHFPRTNLPRRRASLQFVQKMNTTAYRQSISTLVVKPAPATLPHERDVAKLQQLCMPYMLSLCLPVIICLLPDA
jgi:hypothetical protein